MLTTICSSVISVSLKAAMAVVSGQICNRHCDDYSLVTAMHRFLASPAGRIVQTYIRSSRRFCKCQTSQCATLIGSYHIICHTHWTIHVSSHCYSLAVISASVQVSSW